MFRQTSTKQTNAQTQARQPNKHMVEIAGTRSLPNQQKLLSSSGNNAKDNVDFKKNDLVNIQPTNLVRI